MKHLVEGKIPAQTVCPFRVACPAALNNQCSHTGTEHPRPFSCGYARAFEIFGVN